MRSIGDDVQVQDALLVWDSIMSRWNDKKSHEISEKHIPIIKQANQRLNDLINEILPELRQIAAENDSVY